jgi:hypothetical protein
MELKSPDVATVILDVEYGFNVSGQGMMDNNTLVTETWIRTGDQWWYQFQ